MYTDWEDRFVLISELVPGQKFTYQGEEFMRVPPFVECYGNPCDCINTKTGTMFLLQTEEIRVDLELMKVYDIYKGVYL